jgi:hypothetical protein
MGIVAVGLLGVIAILPVAGTRVTQGTVADMADRVGRNAFRQFEILQMGQPTMWRQFSTPPISYSTYSPATNASFCLDPLFIATNKSATGAQYLNKFPYYAGSATFPQMERITLFQCTNLSSGECVADEMFRAQDDLSLSFPSDRALPPVQNFGGNQKRQSDGVFSWMAVVCPNLNALSMPVDEYLLSIVVFLRRSLDVGDENVVQVSTFHSSGRNGGEVTLQSTDPEKLKMKQGEWIMLAGQNASGLTLFRWYRVQAAHVWVDGSNQRDVTLQGQDWPSSLITTTYATWIPGTVAVYEKTFRRETTSLWTEF